MNLINSHINQSKLFEISWTQADRKTNRQRKTMYTLTFESKIISIWHNTFSVTVNHKRSS